MIRQPSATKVAELLKEAFQSEGINFGHQKSLNLAARVQGYKNWAHLQKDVSNECASNELSAPLTDNATPREEQLQEALEWLLSRTERLVAGQPVRDLDECLLHAKRLLLTEKDAPPPFWVPPSDVQDWPVLICYDAPFTGADEDKEGYVFGKCLEELVDETHWGPQVNLEDNQAWPETVALTDDERRKFLVLEEVLSIIPRTDRYGIPMFANEREVGKWATEMGWSYVGTKEHALVECDFHDSGDDSCEQFFAQIRVHPELAKKLSNAGVRFE